MAEWYEDCGPSEWVKASFVISIKHCTQYVESDKTRLDPFSVPLRIEAVTQPQFENWFRRYKPDVVLEADQ